MRNCTIPGSRLEEWWAYERQMAEPDGIKAAALYAMGELAGAEPARSGHARLAAAL